MLPAGLGVDPARAAGNERPGAEAIYNVKSYGMKGDGTAESVSVDGIIERMPRGGAGRLYFPAGTYLLDPFTLPAGKRGMLTGDGPNATTLRLKDECESDLVTVAGEFWEICHLGLDGNKSRQVHAGSALRIGAPRIQVHHLYVFGAKGHGIHLSPVGSNRSAHANLFDNIHILQCDGTGFFTQTVSSGSETPDQMARNIWIGQCGRGIGLESAANWFTNLHVWGSSTDNLLCAGKAGGSNRFVNAYLAESRGNGVTIAGRSGNVLSTCLVLDNAGHGIFVSGGNRTTITSCHVKNNGSDGIHIASAIDCVVTENTFWDDRRPRGQACAVRTVGSADYLLLANNIMKAADHRLGAMFLVGSNNRVGENIE